MTNLEKDNQERVFHYETFSMVVPFMMESNEGFIKSTDPNSALEKIVEFYQHKAGIFSAVIKESPEDPVELAKYLNPKLAELVSKNNNQKY